MGTVLTIIILAAIYILVSSIAFQSLSSRVTQQKEDFEYQLFNLKKELLEYTDPPAFNYGDTVFYHGVPYLVKCNEIEIRRGIPVRIYGLIKSNPSRRVIINECDLIKAPSYELKSEEQLKKELELQLSKLRSS